MGNNVVLLGGGTNRMTGFGWNHIGKSEFAEEFADVAQGLNAAAYAHTNPTTFALASEESAQSCPNQPVYERTLVRKYGDTFHKHSNGIDNRLNDLSYGELSKLRIYVKFESAGSVLPSFADMQTTFGTILDDADLVALWDPNFTWKLSFLSNN